MAFSPNKVASEEMPSAKVADKVMFFSPDEVASEAISSPEVVSEVITSDETGDDAMMTSDEVVCSCEGRPSKEVSD